MIAEVNAPFPPLKLVILYMGLKRLWTGPVTAKHARGNVFPASTDRVAIDGVGMALL